MRHTLVASTMSSDITDKLQAAADAIRPTAAAISCAGPSEPVCVFMRDEADQ
jgi:hypothetical protein